MVGHAPLRKIVGADALRTIPRADLALALHKLNQLLEGTALDELIDALTAHDQANLLAMETHARA